MMSRKRIWQGRWVWPHVYRQANAHVLFRRDFELAAVPQRVIAHLAAESFARVWINGHDLGRTSSVSYPGQHYYESWPVAHALQEGRNQLAVLVRYIGIGSGMSTPKDPGMVMELESDQGRVLVATDDQWRAFPQDAWLGQRRRSLWFNLDLTEIVDRRRLSNDWPTLTDLTTGLVPESLPMPGVRLGRVEARPFTRPTQEPGGPLRLLHGGAVTDQSDAHEEPALAMSSEAIEPDTLDTSLIDPDSPKGFTLAPPASGQAIALLFALPGYEKGDLLLDVDAPSGTVIDIAWHEYLLDGRFDVSRSRVFTASRFILAEGENRIEPEDWMCGRYVQVTFRRFDRPIHVRSIRWRREYYPLSRRWRFTSSDHRLERCVEIGLRSAEICMHDNIMDCPWRERRQWIGDVQRIALINHYAFADKDLVRGVLRQHVQLQEPNGRLWVCQPLLEEFPTQSMEWVRAILEYEQYTDDPTLRGELAPNIARLHAWFADRRDRHGLFFHDVQPVVNWMDNPYHAIRKHQHRTAFTAMNLRYLLFLDDIAAAVPCLGDEARAMRRDIAQQIVAVCVDGPTGLLRDCVDPGIESTFSEMTHALAVLAGLPGMEADALWHRFTQVPPDRTIPAGPFGKYWTFEALGRLGQTDAIIAQVLRCWGPMLDADSDTAWEHFADSGGERASQCHGWAGIPLVALMRHVFKVDPGERSDQHLKGVCGVTSISVERL